MRGRWLFAAPHWVNQIEGGESLWDDAVVP